MCEVRVHFVTSPPSLIPPAVSDADLARSLRVARALAQHRFQPGSKLARQHGPEHQTTRAGATCVKFTPAQRELVDQALAEGENPAEFSREGAILLALLRLEGVAVPVTAEPETA